MADQTPEPDASCPECGHEFDSIWAVSINKGPLPPGFTPIFSPEQRDVARCGQCGKSFERTDGGPWRRQDASS